MPLNRTPHKNVLSSYITGTLSMLGHSDDTMPKSKNNTKLFEFIFLDYAKGYANMGSPNK